MPQRAGDTGRSAGSDRGAIALRVAGLVHARVAITASHPLDFDVRPGLTVVRGGEGRGKGTLLALLAGELAPESGSVVRHAARVRRVEPLPADEATTPLDAWLARQRRADPRWDALAERALLDAFALAAHLTKTAFMLSSGMRRKAALVEAFACGDPVVLIDTPYAALDARACEALDDRLLHAAGDRERAWVVADHEVPRALERATLAALVDLGD